MCPHKLFIAALVAFAPVAGTFAATDADALSPDLEFDFIKNHRINKPMNRVTRASLDVVVVEGIIIVFSNDNATLFGEAPESSIEAARHVALYTRGVNQVIISATVSD